MPAGWNRDGSYAFAAPTLADERHSGRRAATDETRLLPTASARVPKPPPGGPPYDFWIVSTRRCRQRPGWHGPECVYDFLYVGGDASARFGDWHQFCRWLKPGVPVCIVVHGSYVTFRDVMHMSEATFRWLRQAAPHRPVHLVFFTWPSEGYQTPFPIVDMNLLGLRAEYNGLLLAHFVLALPAEHPVSLIGHSHGARLVASCLHALGGGCVRGFRPAVDPARCRRLRAVLAAAALDRHWLDPGRRYGRALYPVESLLVMRNAEDLVLKFYPLRRPLSRQALSRTGFWPVDRARMGPLAVKAVEWDVSPLVGRGHMWPHYYRHPEIARAIAQYVFFDDVDAKDTGRVPFPPSVFTGATE